MSEELSFRAPGDHDGHKQDCVTYHADRLAEILHGDAVKVRPILSEAWDKLTTDDDDDLFLFCEVKYLIDQTYERIIDAFEVTGDNWELPHLHAEMADGTPMVMTIMKPTINAIIELEHFVLSASTVWGADY
jgi:hypothetical protein